MQRKSCIPLLYSDRDVIISLILGYHKLDKYKKLDRCCFRDNLNCRQVKFLIILTRLNI